MRTLIAAMGIMAMLGVGAQARQAGATKVCVLKVTGMSCGACAKTVEKEAKKIDGVKSAKASQPTGQAEITYDPVKTSPEAIAKRITEKSGFKTESPKKQ